VISVSPFCIMHGKIIDDKSELDGMGGVSQQAWCDGAQVISVGLEEVLKLDIGKFSGLGQAIYASLDFNIDMTLVDEWA